jgi:DNA-binding NarL/FixJ family response regulator
MLPPTQATSTKTFNILIVDDESVIRDKLSQYLSQYHDAPYELAVRVASDASSARDAMAEEVADLVISDINMPNETGFELVDFIKKTYPDTKTALITAYQVDDYIRTAKEIGVYNVIAKASPFDFDELSCVVNALLVPDSAFGLAQYLEPETALETCLITSSAEIMTVFNKLRAFLNRHTEDTADDLTSALIEAITNAVYHSAILPDGGRKYVKGQHIEALEPHEYVTVSFGFDRNRLGVSILDQGGRLTPEDVLYWIERHISGSGIMDTHGRGVYLIHTLVDRLIVNIQAGRRTELVILHHFERSFKSNKPLYINVS